MCLSWMLARDVSSFLFGAGLMVQQIVSGHPDPSVLAIASTMMGIPGALHTIAIGRGSSQGSSESPDTSPPSQ